MPCCRKAICFVLTDIKISLREFLSVTKVVSHTHTQIESERVRDRQLHEKTHDINHLREVCSRDTGQRRESVKMKILELWRECPHAQCSI